MTETNGKLSKRELEVIRALSRGCCDIEIARQLHLSASTVNSHTKRIYNKLGVNNRHGAVGAVFRRGILPKLE